MVMATGMATEISMGKVMGRVMEMATEISMGKVMGRVMEKDWARMEMAMAKEMETETAWVLVRG